MIKPLGKLLLAACALITLSCASADNSESFTISSLEDLQDKTVATLTGSVQELLVARRLPNCNAMLMDAISDTYLAVVQGKADATFTSSLQLADLLSSQPELACVCDTIEPSPIGFAFRKGQDELVAQFNEFLGNLKNSPEFEKMVDEWNAPESTRPMPVYDPASCPNGDMQVAVSAMTVPFEYVREGETVGIELEIVSRFAQSIGKHAVFNDMNFNALIPYLSSGKADMAVSLISITDERKKSIDFSDPWIYESSAIIVRKDHAQAGLASEDSGKEPSFFRRVADSFYNNFIKESRYKLIFNGLWMTILISLLAALIGTILGIFLSWCTLSHSRILSKTASLYIEFMRCMPQVVFLMIMFYVVFGNVKIAGSTVAIIAFALCFGAYTSVIFTSTVKGIDKGQTEAALSMGFSKFKSFIHFILPQVTQRALPIYKGEFIGLIKATSIVGYIAVFDLTKAGDIVRSRTYDAFLPLITVTAIYFLIIWLLSLLIRYAEVKTLPTRNKYHKA